MPRDLRTFSTCAGPGVARPHTRLGGFTGFFISLYYANGTLTIIGAVAVLFLLFSIFGLSTLCYLVPVIIVAAEEIKYWYYNERLLCLRDRDCAIGTVISEPTVATDGDRKLNLMLAPYNQPQIEGFLIEHLDRNRVMLTDDANFAPPFHTAAPDMPTLSELRTVPSKFRKYVEELRGEDPNDDDAQSNMWNQVTVGVVDTLLQDPARNFFNRFYRKDPAHITDAATWDYVPVDFEARNWQNPGAQSTLVSPNHVEGGSEKLNPMFRYDILPLVPYLHTEVEGNWIAVLMDDLITAASGIWVGCIFFGVLGGLIGGWVWLLIGGLLFWLLKKFFDLLSGNDGNADEPDVDWDDPDFPGPDGLTETTGDVVAVYGNWIMDTEHHQHFEIHPVRAYYILALTESGETALVEENTGPNFDPTLLTAEQAQTMCDEITRAEEEELPEIIERTGPTLLSYGMTTRYGGGGAAVPVE